ncbi:MAG: competence/damage-inducible protein A [Paludibacter sp.]|nr:competence/damage-inducible protein A [Paludibacter sp.]
MPKVEIITIGDEILIGQIVDTNSAWMASELNKAGFEIAQVTSVHDVANHITASLTDALERADIVLLTGGLGPTKDDITKQTLCEYFDTKLVFSDEVLKNIENLFRNREWSLNKLNRSQAYVPENCTVIQNFAGTAPITWFEKDGKVVVSMPGVPNEMKHVMSREIIPRLQKRFDTPTIIHKTVIVHGYPESQLALKIADWENALPKNIHLAYLPDYGIVRLRLSGASEDGLALEFAINQQVESLTQILGNAITAYEDLPLEVQIGNILKEKGKTLATAESCTGGNIAHKITTVPGSSAYFKGSVVSYANEIKVNVLGVSPEDIENYGAVSEAVVKQMAEGVRKLMKTDFAVATSGIAGPDGGTPEKPVGTVWIAVSSADDTVARQFRYGSARIANIERTTQTAFLMLKEIILCEY